MISQNNRECKHYGNLNDDLLTAHVVVITSSHSIKKSLRNEYKIDQFICLLFISS